MRTKLVYSRVHQCTLYGIHTSVPRYRYTKIMTKIQYYHGSTLVLNLNLVVHPLNLVSKFRSLILRVLEYPGLVPRYYVYLGTSKFSKFSRSTRVLLDLISIIKFPSRPALRFILVLNILNLGLNFLI